MMGLPYGEEIMIVGRTVWTQSTSVTDRRTDGRTDRITMTKTVQRIASHGKNANKGCSSCARVRALSTVTTYGRDAELLPRERVSCPASLPEPAPIPMLSRGILGGDGDRDGWERGGRGRKKVIF